MKGWLVGELLHLNIIVPKKYQIILCHATEATTHGFGIWYKWFQGKSILNLMHVRPLISDSITLY